MLLSNCAVCGKKNHFLLKVKNSIISAIFEMIILQLIKSLTILFYWRQISARMYSKQPGSTYIPCGTFTKHRERIQKFRQTGNLKHLHRNKLNNLDRIIQDRAYEITKNRKYGGYQSGFASMVYKFFGKKIGSRVSVNEKLAEELHKPIIKKFKRTKVYAIFKANIWAADITEMG